MEEVFDKGRARVLEMARRGDASVDASLFYCSDVASGKAECDVSTSSSGDASPSLRTSEGQGESGSMGARAAA